MAAYTGDFVAADSKYVLFSFLLIPLLLSCTSPGTRLDEGGKKVKIRGAISSDEKNAWEQVGSLRCDAGANGVVRFANMEACENDLRNRAAQLGGEVMTLQEESAAEVSTWEASCNNCVALVGIYYKKRTPNDPKKEEMNFTGLEWKEEPKQAEAEPKKTPEEAKKQEKADSEIATLLNAAFSGPAGAIIAAPAGAAGAASTATTVAPGSPAAPSLREPGSTQPEADDVTDPKSDKNPKSEKKPKKPKIKWD